jgi:hypothetical protein
LSDEWKIRAGDVRQRLFDFVKSPGNIERTAEQA